ncbi:MAG: sulfatase family protein [Flavicella sp.]
MYRRHFLYFCLSFVICSNSSFLNAQEKPNIILILADDLGYGDLGCFGSLRIKTPALDKMANEGKKCTQFYASSAVCTPTRVGILTGQYPLRFNVSKHFNDREMFLNNNILTIPKALHKEGYTSMHIGKWHLGGLNEAHVKNRKNSMPGPLEHGFDNYLAMLEDPAYRGVLMREKRLYKDAGKHLVYNDSILAENPKHWTDIKFDTAIEFVTKQSQTKKPFYLHLCLDAPHAPYEEASGKVLDTYSKQKGDDRLYRGMVSHLDKGVGRILQNLKKLKIDQNTLVVFTSDNGPAFQGSPGYFKGRKVDFHEGGIRVPMIAWWPGKIKPGSKSDALLNTIDLLPTFLRVASGKKKMDNSVDGMDITNILTVGKKAIERPTMFWEISTSYKKNHNYRKTTDILRTPKTNQIARNGKWKLLAIEGVAYELYNLEEDPYERWNLIHSHKEITQKLEKELNHWLQEPRQEKPY